VRQQPEEELRLSGEELLIRPAKSNPTSANKKAPISRRTGMGALIPSLLPWDDAKNRWAEVTYTMTGDGTLTGTWKSGDIVPTALLKKEP
jgi:hypothetical protein